MNSYYPTTVKPLENYRLLITFDNNEVKINPLTIEWAGGIDICPDELYYNSMPI